MILEVTEERRAAASSSDQGLVVPAGRHVARRDRSGQLVAGRYRILRLLGEGGMGSVWLALDCQLSRSVAVKEVRDLEDPARWRTDESRALEEARAAAHVSHPGVVQIYDFVVWGGREWIVMEALSGPTLAYTIRQDGSLPSARVVDIGLWMLEALQAVHQAGFIHGDVKPANVQMNRIGRPVLTDFGLACRAGDARMGDAAHVAGSPPYMAPEVIRTGARVPASDLFALGATLYEAVEGRRPFDDGSPAASALAVLRHVPPPAVGGAPLGRLIDGLLIKDPRRRLGLPEALDRLRDLRSELRGRPSPVVRGLNVPSPETLEACNVRDAVRGAGCDRRWNPNQEGACCGRGHSWRAVSRRAA